MRYLIPLLALALAACDRPLFEPLPKAKQQSCTTSEHVIHGDTTAKIDSQRVTVTVCL